MTVGFVNSGMMKLEQAVGIIMGSNIGTTITLWILALTGLDSSLWYVQIFKPTSFAPVLAILGIALVIFSKRNKRRDIGATLVSFAVLMYGMTLMSDTCSQLAGNPIVADIFSALENPILGLLVGAVFTGIIQASAATLGIIQALAVTGVISYGAAIPLILGSNIGTCVTALISCIGAGKGARRTAMVHLYFNIIGSIFFMGAFYLGDAIFDFSFTDSPLDAKDIALIHTLFNVTATALLLPFGGLLAKLAKKTVPDKKDSKDNFAALLDDRFLTMPAFAVDQCVNVASTMAKLAHQTILDSLSLLNKWDDKLANKIIASEDDLDMYEDRLGSYLVKVSQQPLSLDDSKRINQLLHVIGDFERIGDHAVNILESAREMKEKKLVYSTEAIAEIEVMLSALKEILQLSFDAYLNNDYATAQRVEPLEDVIDILQQELRNRHINRLQKGESTIQLGFIINDLIANIERVSDHCSNLAVDLIEVSTAQFNTHSYLNTLKQDPPSSYTEHLKEYTQKYNLS